jgi:hypothetical protein
MPALVLWFLAFHAFCVAVLVVLAHVAPLCDEDERPLSRQDAQRGRAAGTGLAGVLALLDSQGAWSGARSD